MNDIARSAHFLKNIHVYHLLDLTPGKRGALGWIAHGQWALGLAVRLGQVESLLGRNFARTVALPTGA